MVNVYQVITDRILAALEKGIVPWRCPFTTQSPKNLVSGRPYRGVNVLLLQSLGHASPYFVTFNQARSLGGSVKRGEHGCPVIFWKRYDDAKTEKERFVLRFYTVFGLNQTEGIAAPEVSSVRVIDPIAACENVIASYRDRPRIEHGGGRACYVPALDTIHMPPREAFLSAPEYYSTIFHELTHSSGAAHRLARKGVVDLARFASHDYAFEELVAECGSAFLAAHAGISFATLENSAAYIGSWAKRLRSEPRWIVEASSAAMKAAEFILGTAAREHADADSGDGVAA